MPNNAPKVKREATEFSYNGIIVECEPTLQAREITCARVLKETGATLIHPFNNSDIIAGQGTIV
jgi:threonine dehydratase